MRRFSISIILLVAIGCTSCLHAKPAPDFVRVLFVGNSLVYVGNLPAVFDALATANGRKIQSDMLVKGGASLSDRVADGSVERALATKHYDYVVLQERGGDMLCGFGPSSCKNAVTSLGILADSALRHSAKPTLLGTYQDLPEASASLVQAEESAATRLSISYVPLSERFQVARVAAPKANWLFKDGMHPGHDLILLEAALLYQDLFRRLPSHKGFTVIATMYTPHSEFATLAPIASDAAAPGASSSYTYTANSVAAVLAIASHRSP